MLYPSFDESVSHEQEEAGSTTACQRPLYAVGLTAIM